MKTCSNCKFIKSKLDFKTSYGFWDIDFLSFWCKSCRNRLTCFYTNLRRAYKLNRVPRYSDLEAIKKFYFACPPGMTVDHIVPLQGKNVSGFHVEYNLQYLTRSENSKKSNKF